MSGCANFSQLGGRITVDVTRRRNRRGQELTQPRKTRYVGRAYGGQFVLNFRQKSAPNLIVGNVTLGISGNLRLMKGYTTYLDHDEGRVVSHPIFFERRESD